MAEPVPSTSPRARVWLLAVTAVAALANLPLLAVTGLFADDWTWFHLYATEGGGAVQRAMVAVAHPLYGPWFVAAFAAGEWAGPLARGAALALHLLNGWLLFRVLRRPRLTRRAAPLAAAIFLLSPFYTARGMLAHTQYDLFLAAWLGSVVWMGAHVRAKRWAAPPLMALAMGLEPLMLLEPLRLLFAWQNERRPMALALRLAPFWAIAAATALLRFTLLKPTGHYAGFRTISLSPGPLAEQLALSFVHLPAAIAFSAWEAFHALPAWQLGLVLAAAAAACWRGIGGVPPAARGRRETLLGLGLAGALVALGALPYALSGDHAWPTRFESRFAFASQLGAALGVAVLIATMPLAALRRATAWTALTVFALGALGDAKWLLLDQRIQSALQRELLPTLLEPAPRLIRLEIAPPSNRSLYRFRCLGAADLNVAADLRRPAWMGKSFIYETSCGDWDRLAPATCSVAYLDRAPCPAAREERGFRIPAGALWTGATIWDALGEPPAER